jgi:hypothetical protein
VIVGSVIFRSSASMKALLRMTERVAGLLELFLPVDLAPLLQPVAVQRLLGVGRLDEPLEMHRLARVVVLHFLVDAPADQFADGDPLGEEFQHGLAGRFSGRRLVPNGQCCRGHRGTPRD